MSGIQAQSRVSAPLTALAWAPLPLDPATGYLAVAATFSGSISGVVAGTHTPSDAYPNPSDAIDALAATMGWTGANWRRVTVNAPQDGLVGPAGSALQVQSFPQVYDPVGVVWNRLYSYVPGDAITNPGVGAQGVSSFGEMYDQDANLWKRVRAFTLADNVDPPSTTLAAAAFLMAWDGARVRRLRAIDSTQTLTPSQGGLVVAFDQTTSPNSVFVNYGSGGGATKVLVKSQPATLFGVDVSLETLTTHTKVWFMLFDRASAPVNGNTPVYRRLCTNAVLLAGGFTVGQEFFGSGLSMSFPTGLAYGWSTTGGTFTDAATGGDVLSAVNIDYR